MLERQSVTPTTGAVCVEVVTFILQWIYLFIISLFKIGCIIALKKKKSVLELFDVYEIENLSYVAKRQKIMYNDTIEYHHWGVCGWSMQTGQILEWVPLHQNQSSNVSRKLQVNSTRR